MFKGLLWDNSTEEHYESIVANFNSTAENFTIKTCSLEEQLDGVNKITSSKNYSVKLLRKQVRNLMKFFFNDYQAAEGTGLAFIVFTQAIVELPGAPFWSCIFFLMLLALGLGSQIGILEGMLCVIFDIDLFKRVKKQYITGK